MKVSYKSLNTQETLDETENFLGLNGSYPDFKFQNSKLNNPQRFKLISNFEEIRAKFL